jgi:hypothetical protein
MNTVTETMHNISALADRHPAPKPAPVMTKDEMARLVAAGRVSFTHDGEATPVRKGYIRRRPYTPAQDAVNEQADHRFIEDTFRKLQR